MNLKKHIGTLDALDWISVTCTFTLLTCICTLKWNSLSPAETWVLQPELLLVATLVLSGLWMDVWSSARRILPLMGTVLEFVGLAMLLEPDSGMWAKLVLCVGMGPVLCATLYKLWQQLSWMPFLMTICFGSSIGIMFAAAPMLLDHYQIWPLLTSGLAAGILIGFLRPAKPPCQEAGPRPSTSFRKNPENLWVALILGVSSLGTGVSYKWFFLGIPLPAMLYVALLCAGICAVGVILLRFERRRAVSLFFCVLITLNLLQLITHADCPFANATSYALFGIYFASFLFAPYLVWQEEMNALRSSLGAGAGFFCMIVVPRTLSVVAPQDWLFKTQLGWMLQTASLALLFLGFCLFNRGLFSATLEEPLALPAESDARHPLPDCFTKREYEVAILILQGKTHKEIGAQLSIAESTVKTHIGHLLEKANCRTKTQFIAAYRA